MSCKIPREAWSGTCHLQYLHYTQGTVSSPVPSSLGQNHHISHHSKHCIKSTSQLQQSVGPGIPDQVPEVSFAPSAGAAAPRHHLHHARLNSGAGESYLLK